MRACPRCGASYEADASFCPADGTKLEEAPARATAWSAGAVLGSYRLLELLGEGGMGRVYLAEHTRLGRRVALKMLRPEVAAHPQAVRRFFAEARAVNRLVHENVVEITDFFEGEGPDEPRFYIMELLQGQSLRQLLEREGAQRQERVLGIGRQLASALAAVHEAGIVHRDLKPENVFLVERGGRPDFVKLLDFGIARHLQPDDGDPRTALGAVLGTPEYMAPEQAAGEAGVDGRADVYALGIILYELLTGAQPIRGASFTETMARQVTFVPPPPGAVLAPGAVAPELEALIVACLEKEPGRRPQSMREVEARLAALAPAPVAAIDGSTRRLHGTALRAPAPTDPSEVAAPLQLSVAPAPAPAEAPRRSRLPLVALLVLVACAAGGGAWLLLRDASGTAPAAAAAPPDAPPATTSADAEAPDPDRAHAPATAAVPRDATTPDAAPARAPATVAGPEEVAPAGAAPANAQATRVPEVAPAKTADDVAPAPARGRQKAPAPRPARATPPAPR